MKRIDSKIFTQWVAMVLFGCFVAGCATSGHELKTEIRHDVYPATEINAEKVYAENRGLIILEENATMIHDCYRGGVQRKEQGEKLLKEGKWEDARIQFEKSNGFLRVVLKYRQEDDANYTLYGEQKAIFLPNLLVADNNLKLMAVYKSLGKGDKVAQARSDGQSHVAESLKSVKTEWGYSVQRGFEDESNRK